jgi:hypothetical protein
MDGKQASGQEERYVRRRLKAPSLGSISGTGDSRSRQTWLGIVCLVGLAALLGSGASSAGAVEPCPNSQFRLGAGANLPDCRAYEQVSPVDKNGGDIIVNRGSGSSVAPLGAGYSASPTGDRAIFSAETEFAGASSGGSLVETIYIAGRGPDGWVTEELAPRVTPAAARRDLRLSSPDLSHSLLTSDGELQLDPPHPSEGDVNIYSRDNLTGAVTMWFGVEGSIQDPTVSTSWDRVVFGDRALLTTDPGVLAEPLKVYEKVGDQPARLVSVLPDGTPSQSETAVGGRMERFASTVGAVSDDGSHVFFSEISAGQGQGIYRRSNGTTTLLVSPSKRATVDSAEATGEVFRLATADGNRILFTSGSMLTDDANTGPSGEFNFRPGNDLYRFDIEADELVDISATAIGNGAEVQGVLGADAEAERVYYAAKGEVIPGQGTPGQANVYLWEDDGSPGGTNRFIASIAPYKPGTIDSPESLGDSSNWSLDSASTARVTADGRYLLFQSAASIPGGEEGGLTQVYRYDAEADGGAGRLDCVSCNSGGETPIGPAAVTPGAFGLQYRELPRNLTEDGRVFFTSKDALLPADTNGQDDVYAWTEGELNLISTGTSPRGSNFNNASLDGSSVLFYTSDALVPQDGDDLVDLYDARVNGGLASQFAVPHPGCSGEECRGAVTPPPASQSPLTPSFSGPGNAKPRRCPKGKRKVTLRNGKTRCVKRKGHKRHHKHAQQTRPNNDQRAGR